MTTLPSWHCFIEAQKHNKTGKKIKGHPRPRQVQEKQRARATANILAKAQSLRVKLKPFQQKNFSNQCQNSWPRLETERKRKSERVSGRGREERELRRRNRSRRRVEYRSSSEKRGRDGGRREENSHQNMVSLPSLFSFLFLGWFSSGRAKERMRVEARAEVDRGIAQNNAKPRRKASLASHGSSGSNGFRAE